MSAQEEHVRLALLLLALAAPLSGQAIDFSPRFVRFAEAAPGVRLGTNHGNAVALALRVESGWIRATLWTSATEAIWWEPGTENGPNPPPDHGSADVDLLGVSIGPGVRVGPLGLTLGAGAFVMTCDNADCRSSPHVDALLSADADLCTPARPLYSRVPAFRACLRAGVEGVAPRDGRWTWWERDRGGVDPHGRKWMLGFHLGPVFGLRF